MDIQELKQELGRNLKLLNRFRDHYLAVFEETEATHTFDPEDIATIFSEWRQTVGELGAISEYEEMEKKSKERGGNGSSISQLFNELPPFPFKM